MSGGIINYLIQEDFRLSTMRNTIIKFIVVAFIFLLPLITFAIEPNVKVFMYHRFNQFKYPETNISSKVFEEQMKYLINHNYKILPLTELISFLKKNKKIPKSCTRGGGGLKLPLDRALRFAWFRFLVSQDGPGLNVVRGSVRQAGQRLSAEEAQLYEDQRAQWERLDKQYQAEISSLKRQLEDPLTHLTDPQTQPVLMMEGAQKLLSKKAFLDKAGRPAGRPAADVRPDGRRRRPCRQWRRKGKHLIEAAKRDQGDPFGRLDQM